MIDLATGRFKVNDSIEFYPGMMREEFLNNKEIVNLLRNKDDLNDPKNYTYFLKQINIEGFEMIMSIDISPYNDYVTDISLTKADYYDVSKWPNNDYIFDIKEYNDAFLSKQLEASYSARRELWFDYDWGSINSTINNMHYPSAFIKINYNVIPFLEARGLFKYKGEIY